MYVRINENGRLHEQAHGDCCANSLKTILGSEEQIGTMQHLKHFQSPRGTRSVCNGRSSEAGVGNGVHSSSCVGHL